MRVLLDTHTFLWFISGDSRLGAQAKALVADFSNEVVISVVSLWEIAIKVSLGKLTLARPFDDLIAEQLELHEITWLAIELEHLTAVISLPLHHRDPFDRLIAAQASVEGLPLVSKDRVFQKYQIQVIW